MAALANNQIPAVDVLLAWCYGLALGAERFEHLTRYRRDPLLPRLLGLPRFPSPDTVRRFFQGFTYRRTTEVSEALMRISLAAMRPILLGHTLDLDSTVFCRYGDQAASLKDHNPIKHGRPSHHPLVAWLSERRRLLWATLRAGHAGTAYGALLAYPVREALIRLAGVQRVWSYYLPISLILAQSGLFEIIESVVAAFVSPELGGAYLGMQGDVWDAQKDMAAAFGGAALAMIVTLTTSRGFKKTAHRAHRVVE